MKFGPTDMSAREALRASKTIAAEDLDLDQDRDQDGIQRQVKAAFRTDRYGR